MAVPFLSARIRRPFFHYQFPVLFLIQKLFRKCYAEVFCQMAEFIRCDRLAFRWLHRKCFYQDFCRFFCGMHQTEGQVKNQSRRRTCRGVPRWQDHISSSARSWQRRSLCLPEPSTERHRFRTGIQQGTRLPSPRVRG